MSYDTEAVSRLRVSCILQQKTMVVVEKNSRLRRITLAPPVKELLETYIRDWNLPWDGYLFPHRSDPRRCSPAIARRLLRSLCKRAGVTRINPHQFRHYLVKRCMAHGSALEDVGKFLGHVNTTTTFLDYWCSNPHTATTAVVHLDAHTTQRKQQGPRLLLAAEKREIARLRLMLEEKRIKTTPA